MMLSGSYLVNPMNAKSSSEGDKEESNESGYDEDMYQLEERKEETGEATINHVFYDKTF